MAKPISNIRAFFLLLAILSALLAIDITAVFWYNRHVNDFISGQPMIKHADAGVVFFGDYMDDGAALGPDSKHRAQVAAGLYKNRVIRKVICVGGYDNRKWKGKPHLMKMFLEEQNVPPNDIYYDSLSFNTITNWVEAQKIIQHKNYDSVIAIRAPLHIYRIAKMINDTAVFYDSYTYRLNSFKSYWRLYLDVHHEWVSMFLSMALRDEARNRLVYIVRTALEELNDLF